MSESHSQPYFSVIIPTYNRAGMIGSAVEHVLTQSFTDLELIVVDDGSTDNTRAVLDAIEDHRLTVVHQENKGRSVARNNGIDLAKGEFICFQDSDDIWEKDHLAILHQAASKLERPTLLFTHLVWRFPDGDKLRKLPELVTGLSPVEYVVKEEVSTITVAISSAILKEFRFDPVLVINEDLHLWARIASKYPIQLVDSSQAIAIQHEENTRLVVKDAITPRIEATLKMFSDLDCGTKFSPEFKKNRMMGLEHEFINWLGDTGQRFKQSIKIVQFLFKYPSNPQNRSKLVALLHNIPLVGALLRRSSIVPIADR